VDQAALHLRTALTAQPHDIRVRRALRRVLARCSPLYRVVGAPRTAVDWLRGHLATSRFGFLPLIELGHLAFIFLGILLNPFHALRPAALFLGIGLMAVWWPLVASLEAMASVRLRSPEASRTAGRARDALAATGARAAALTSLAAVALVLLWRPVHEVLPAAFLLTFFAVNATLLGGGLLVTEIARHARLSRRCRRVAELLVISG
jgi:hypothetical protein